MTFSRKDPKPCKCLSAREMSCRVHSLSLGKAYLATQTRRDRKAARGQVVGTVQQWVGFSSPSPFFPTPHPSSSGLQSCWGGFGDLCLLLPVGTPQTISALDPTNPKAASVEVHISPVMNFELPMERLILSIHILCVCVKNPIKRWWSWQLKPGGEGGRRRNISGKMSENC